MVANGAKPMSGFGCRGQRGGLIFAPRPRAFAGSVAGGAVALRRIVVDLGPPGRSQQGKACSLGESRRCVHVR